MVAADAQTSIEVMLPGQDQQNDCQDGTGDDEMAPAGKQRDRRVQLQADRQDGAGDAALY